jgi:hypothetical protein
MHLKDYPVDLVNYFFFFYKGTHSSWHLVNSSAADPM